MTTYSGDMTTAQIEKSLTENIQRWIAARGSTRKHVYTHAGMSRQTFERSIDGGRSLTIREAALIGEALGVSLSDLIPEALELDLTETLAPSEMKRAA